MSDAPRRSRAIGTCALIVALAASFAGCRSFSAGAERASRDAAPPETAEGGYDGPPAPEAAPGDAGGVAGAGGVLMGVAEKGAAAGAERTESKTPSGGGGAAAAPKERRPPERAMVVYQGQLKLRVKRLLEASEAVVRMAEQGGGHVASLGARVIVVRVPASDFEAVMNAFATLGEVLDRRVWALDVTAQYTDLEARLDVATLARERLLELLARTDDPDERLKIVKEVKRLTERIEAMRATLAALKNLVDLYTITIELVPAQDGVAPDQHRSPFGWVRNLAPHRPSLGGTRRDLSFEVPRDFVLFDRSKTLLAQGADASTIRGGHAKNQPRGDEAFWLRAVEHEMEGRDAVHVKRGAAGAVQYAVFRNKDVEPHYYLVAVRTTGERVYVIEAFFPTAESYEARGESVIRALGTLKVGADA